jgi:hypothetical protein
VPKARHAKTISIAEKSLLKILEGENVERLLKTLSVDEKREWFFLLYKEMVDLHASPFLLLRLR